jgi:hypothetical protein
VSKLLLPFDEGKSLTGWRNGVKFARRARGLLFVAQDFLYPASTNSRMRFINANELHRKSRVWRRHGSIMHPIIIVNE